jgi:DNA-binding NarL/FixJ family response regulator
VSGKQTEEQTRMLTKREREVAELAAQGLFNKEIAAILSIAEQTVKNHMQNIFAKMQVDNRVKLALRLRSSS